MEYFAEGFGNYFDVLECTLEEIKACGMALELWSVLEDLILGFGNPYRF